MAPTTFNDGDPIDAATLQSLVTEIATLRSSIPNITTAGTKIELSGATGAVDTVIPKFWGGVTKSIKLTPGVRSYFDIDYSAAKFTSKPKSIILTPVSADKNESMGVPSIVSGSVSNTGAKGQILGIGVAKTITINFIAIQN